MDLNSLTHKKFVYIVFSKMFKFGFGLYIFTFPNFNQSQLIAFRFRIFEEI
jgi:hypothetical protein